MKEQYISTSLVTRPQKSHYMNIWKYGYIQNDQNVQAKSTKRYFIGL
jgi:hypothetical protein